MADSKPKKSAPKLFDVSKPGKAAPSSTARPVIISNRPVLKDPMVIQVSSDDEEPTTIETTTTESTEMKHKVDIQPLHIDLSEVLGAPAVKADKVSKDTTPKDDTPIVAETPEVATEAVTEEKKAEAAVPAEPEKPAEEAPAAEPEQPVPAVEDKPAPAPRRTTGERVIAPLGPIAAEPEKPTEAPTETPVSEPDEEPLPNSDDEPSLDNSDTPVLSEKEAKAAEAAKKKADEQEQIIASGQYYLPINRVEKRRAKRNVIIGVLMLILLLTVAALAAWDAGLVSIPGMQAPTNFL
jgi:hypothetical protein